MPDMFTAAVLALTLSLAPSDGDTLQLIGHSTCEQLTVDVYNPSREAIAISWHVDGLPPGQGVLSPGEALPVNAPGGPGARVTVAIEGQPVAAWVWVRPPDCDTPAALPAQPPASFPSPAPARMPAQHTAAVIAGAVLLGVGLVVGAAVLLTRRRGRGRRRR